MGDQDQNYWQRRAEAAEARVADLDLEIALEQDAAGMRDSLRLAEINRLREALVRIGYSVAGAHPEAMRKIARDALNKEGYGR